MHYRLSVVFLTVNQVTRFCVERCSLLCELITCITAILHLVPLSGRVQTGTVLAGWHTEYKFAMMKYCGTEVTHLHLCQVTRLQSNTFAK